MQDNVRYGNEAQLLGGYAAGCLLLSAVSGLVYLFFWLLCTILLVRLARVLPLPFLISQGSVPPEMFLQPERASVMPGTQQLASLWVSGRALCKVLEPKAMYHRY